VSIIATPKISPIVGSYREKVEVTLKCKTPGVAIYYTIDGSTPDATDNLYTDGTPIQVSSTTTIKAIGILAGFTSSVVATSIFTIVGLTYQQNVNIKHTGAGEGFPVDIVNIFNTVATPVISPSSYSINQNQTVSITCATGGSVIYYTIDGSIPDRDSTQYTAPFLLTSEKVTVKAIAYATGYNKSTVKTKVFFVTFFTYWNPDDKYNVTLSGDNLVATAIGAGCARAISGKSSGKWYWESVIVGILDSGAGNPTNNWQGDIGVGNIDCILTGYIGLTLNGWSGISYKQNDQLYCYHKTHLSTINTMAYSLDNTVMMIALNMDTGKLWFGRNGTWSGDPVAGTGQAFSGITGTIYPMVNPRDVGGYGSLAEVTTNFGALDFTYTIPTGFSGFSL